MDDYMLRLGLGGVSSGLLFVPMFRGTNLLIVNAFFDPARPRLMAAMIMGSIFIAMMVVGVVFFSIIHMLQLQPMGQRALMFVVFAVVGWLLFWVFLEARFLVAIGRRRD